MKKLLITLGIVFLALVVIVAAFIGYTAYSGSVLDKESKAYVDAAVPAIISSWNEQALLKRASPEFQNATENLWHSRLAISISRTAGGRTDFDR
jgi:hypothetical protein